MGDFLSRVLLDRSGRGGDRVTAGVDYIKAAFAISSYNLLGRVIELRLDFSIATVT